MLPISIFNAYLTALQLRHPGIASLYSLNAARINYIPYQFKPALKLIRSDRPRLLIADEVGVGKTIEAGLILRELQSRRDINSVLILCPKALVTERKWQVEMKRFDEYFEHIDSSLLRHCLSETDKDGVWPDRYSKCILSFSLFNEELLYGISGGQRRGSRRRHDGLVGLEPSPHFDLVIVDEAHHLRNTDTFVHQGVRFFCENAEAVIFLTATPIQLGSENLFVLLNLLRPDLIIDRASFEHMAEPNPLINRAIAFARKTELNWQANAYDALLAAGQTNWGRAVLQNDPSFQRLAEILTAHQLTDIERINFIKDTEQLYTFSSLINRTRRRDIGKFTTRKPETVTINFSSAHRLLHDRVLDFQRQVLTRLHGDSNIIFMMTTIRRQAASCLFGLVPLLKEILTRRLNEIEWEEAEGMPDQFDIQHIANFEEEIREILLLAERLPSDDPKLDALLKTVNEKQDMPNNKILLFSSFRHTLVLQRNFQVDI